MDRRVPAVDGENPIFSQSRRSCIHSLWLAAWIMALFTPRLSADITLVTRLSDARAFATIGVGSDSPPPQIQTDFLPATLSNSAAVSAESGAARASCTSNSSIVADKQMGTLQITGDGNADADAILMDSYGHGSAKLIVISFTLTDRSYSYSLTGQLLAEQFKGVAESTGTAKLTAGGVTIFEVVAAHPPAVILSQTGVLEPGDYTLSVEIDAAGYGTNGPHAGASRDSANFNFTLGPTPTPTPTATASPTPTATATATATATPSPSPTPAAQALNLSTRMMVQTGDNVGIGGFIITGSVPKRVILRGIGPSLAGTGVPDPLADPVLELRDASGQLIASNDDWCSPPPCLSCCDQIIATGIPPTNELESAIVRTLSPGPYTAIVKGKNNGVGVGLVEVYDLDQAAASKLANISTRAFVGTGSDIVIAGFILGGNLGDDNIIVRGIGPSLTQFGVPNALANPTLELRDVNGALIRANNNWQDDPAQAALISAAGLAPTNPLESGIAATLPPGQYTVLFAGLNNGTGVGLVEVYDREAPL